MKKQWQQLPPVMITTKVDASTTIVKFVVGDESQYFVYVAYHCNNNNNNNNNGLPMYAVDNSHTENLFKLY